MSTDPNQERPDRDYPEGASELPRAGAPSGDPYTPEPGPRPGEGSAFDVLWLAWLVVAVVVAAVIVWALVL